MKNIKKISIDNGNSFCTPEEATETIWWEVIESFMDDHAMRLVHDELSPCSEVEFLKRYLELAPCDLIVG